MCLHTDAHKQKLKCFLSFYLLIIRRKLHRCCQKFCQSHKTLGHNPSSLVKRHSGPNSRLGGSPRGLLIETPPKKPFTPELLLTDHPVYPPPTTSLWGRFHRLFTKLLQSAHVSKTFGLHLNEAANCPLLVARTAGGHHALCYLLLYI